MRFLSLVLLIVVTFGAVTGRKKGRSKKEPKDKDTDRGEDETPDLKDGWNNDGVIWEYGNYEYLSVAHHVSVYDAEEACKRWRGDLASIHSVSENIAVKDHIRSRYAWIGVTDKNAEDHIRSRYAWIGVTDKDAEGRYKNMDGSAFNFNSYARGQPNDYKNEDFTIVKDNGAWYDSGPPRRDHPFGPKHGYVCKRKRVEVEIPEEFSCFENLRFWEIHDCQNRHLGTWGSYKTITSGSESLPELCIAAFNSTLSRGKDLPQTNNYVFKMTLESLAGFMNSNNRGHVGVAFNIIDEDHFDFIFFRLNTPKHCFSTGYKDGATVQITATGPCSDVSITGQDDVIIHVFVNGHSVQIKADGIQIKSFTSRFSGRNSAAALTRNGKYYQGNTVGFKNTMVCQPVQCKVQVGDHTVMLDWKEIIRTKTCETCRCQKFGQLDCQCDEQADVVCGPGEVATYDKECCKKCIPQPARCVITGDPHYYTFDKIWHHFQGVCKYVLVKTADFEVHHGNEVRHGNTAVTWTKEVMIWFKDSEYSIKKGHLFAIDDIQKVVPYRKVFPDGYTVDVKRIGSFTHFTLHKEGSDLMEVKFDGDHRIRIVLQGVYKGTTQGLCGTWNDNQQDEYQTREGVITNDLNEFGNSWKEKDDEFCPDPPPPPHVCDDQPELWDVARDVCSKLNETMFSPCHSLVDRSGYYEACLVDVCMCLGDRSCGCSSVASYADQCSERGISINWRTAQFCPLPCEAGFQFNHCGSECVATCSDPDPDCDRSVCVEGCFCPEGKLFFDNECIDPQDCVCTWEGEIRDIGDVWDNQETCQTCTCVDAGNIVCNDTICEECPDGHVPVVVDEEECCPTCVTDWLLAVDDTTDFKRKVGDSVSFAVEIDLPAPVEVPAERLKWEKRRMENVLQTKKYDISEDRRQLTINDLTLQDEGVYRLRACIDANFTVCGSIEFRLSIKNDVILAVDPEQTVSELDSVTFGVIIVGVDPQPGYKQLMWLHGDEELLPPKSKRISAMNGRRNITISNVVKADAGSYRCGLTLDDGSYHWADFTLTVEDGDTSDILVAVQTPVTTMHSSSATLAVKTTIKNVPPSAFTWIKDDAFIDVANNPKYSFVNYRKGLLIRDVQESDAGIYTAQMMYEKIHKRVNIELRINTAEVDVRPENSPLKTVVGQTAHFLVTIDSVNSVPWKSVNWYRIGADGNRVKTLTPPSGRYKTPDNRRKLVIQAVQKSDEGFYEVEVTHKGSVVSARVELQVLESKWVNSQ